MKRNRITDSMALQHAVPWPGFKVWGSKLHIYRGKIFVFIACLKQIFLGTTKFEGK